MLGATAVMREALRPRSLWLVQDVSGKKISPSIHHSFLSCFLASRHAGILGPQPEIKPVPPALEVQSLTHWTARQVQIYH